MNDITLEKAKELYRDARDFYDGKVDLPPAHQIRVLAVNRYNRHNTSLLMKVCSDIFRVMAEEYWLQWNVR